MSNHKTKIMAKAVSLVLLLAMTVSLVSCVDTSKAEDYLSNFQNIDKVTTTTVAPTEATATPEGYTPMPIVQNVMRTDSETIIVAGTCAENAVIFLEGPSVKATSVNAVGDTFIAEVKFTGKSDDYVSVKAKAGDLLTSQAYTVPVKYDGTAEKRLDGKSMVMGNDSWMFFESEVDNFATPSLDRDSTLPNYTTWVNNKISAANKEGNTEFIFVIVPSRLTMNPDKSPAEKTTVNSMYTQISYSLKNSSATVIDCYELFNKIGDEAKYPLYYRTDSNWSEYAAFLAYTELMNYISGGETVLDYTKEYDKEVKELETTTTETGATTAPSTSVTAPEAPAGNNGKFPAAKPLTLDQFNALKLNSFGGDVLTYSSIDRSLITEEFVRFTAKDASIFKIGSEMVKSKTDENELVASPNISEVKKYVSAEDSLYYVGDGKDGSEKGTNEANGFRTGRTDLPSALILKDDSATPIFDLLAERFNNSYFFENGRYKYDTSKAESYAGTEGNASVDYIIYFVSEENLKSMLTGLNS